MRLYTKIASSPAPQPVCPVFSILVLHQGYIRLIAGHKWKGFERRLGHEVGFSLPLIYADFNRNTAISYMKSEPMNSSK